MDEEHVEYNILSEMQHHAFDDSYRKIYLPLNPEHVILQQVENEEMKAFRVDCALLIGWIMH